MHNYMVSNSTKQRADNSGNRADLTYKNLSRYDLTAQFYLKLLHEWSDKKGRVTEQIMANVHMSRTVFNWPHFYTFFSFCPTSKRGFQMTLVLLQKENLQMLFFECLSLVFFLFNKPLWEFLTIHGLKIFSQCSPPAMNISSRLLA